MARSSSASRAVFTSTSKKPLELGDPAVEVAEALA